MKFKRKLTKKGFSAVEIVIAVVAVVVVAGLGYFAYTNYTNSDESAGENDVASLAEESGVSSNEQADALTAEAKYSKTIKTSNGQTGVWLCTYNRGRQIKAIFISRKNYKSSGYRSSNVPRVDIRGYGRNSGKSAYLVRGGQAWWLGTVQLHYGNVPSWANRYSDYVRVALGSSVGSWVKYSAVPAC